MSDLRKRLFELYHRHYTCIRPQCNYRTFKSKDRYETHMKLHKLQVTLAACYCEWLL